MKTRIFAGTFAILLALSACQSKPAETEEPVKTPVPTQQPTPEPTEAPTLEPTVEPTSEPTPEPTPEPTEEPSAGIRPEVKEMIDGYESFMNEYIDFMEAADDDSTDLNYMMKYLDFVSRYAEYEEKIDALGDADLNDAEFLYYTEVTLRVEKRLLEILD